MISPLTGLRTCQILHTWLENRKDNSTGHVFDCRVAGFAKVAPGFCVLEVARVLTNSSTKYKIPVGGATGLRYCPVTVSELPKKIRAYLLTPC